MLTLSVSLSVHLRLYITVCLCLSFSACVSVFLRQLLSTGAFAQQRSPSSNDVNPVWPGPDISHELTRWHRRPWLPRPSIGDRLSLNGALIPRTINKQDKNGVARKSIFHACRILRRQQQTSVCLSRGLGHATSSLHTNPVSGNPISRTSPASLTPLSSEPTNSDINIGQSNPSSSLWCMPALPEALPGDVR